MSEHNILWSKSAVKTATFTKDYAVGFKRTDCNIPDVLLNFVDRQTGHSNCIMQLEGEWGKHNTFAECSRNYGPQFTQHYGWML